MVHRDIASTETDPFAPITAALMKALDQNVDATFEGAAGAPYNHYEWHPYNGVFIGDGVTGLIYDVAVGGVVASVDSPLPLLPGYDYRWRLRGVSTSSTANIRFLARRASTGVFTAGLTAFDAVTSATAGESYNVEAALLRPHVSDQRHVVEFSSLLLTALANGGSAALYQAFRYTHAANEVLDGFRVTTTSGLFDAGQFFLDKRRSIV